MPSYSGNGKIDSRFIAQGGLEFSNFSDNSINTLFSLPTLVVPVKYKLEPGWSIVQGNPSSISVDIQGATVSQNSNLVPGYKTEGYVVNEGMSSLVEIYYGEGHVNEGDFIRANGSIIYGIITAYTQNQNSITFTIQLYIDPNPDNPVTFNGNSFDNISPAQHGLILILPKRMSIKNVRDLPLRADFQVGLLTPEQVNDIRNLQDYTGAGENEFSPNFSSVNNLSSQNSLVSGINYLNTNVIGNLNNLQTTDKSSVVNSINNLLNEGVNQVQLLKRKVYGGIIESPSVQIGQTPDTVLISPSTLTLWNRHNDKVDTVTLNSVTISDANTYIWDNNSNQYVNPTSDFTNKAFILFLRYVNNTWTPIFVEVGDNLNILGDIGNYSRQDIVKDSRAYGIYVFTATRNNSDYTLTPFIKFNAFLESDWKNHIAGVFNFSNFVAESVTITGASHSLYFTRLFSDTAKSLIKEYLIQNEPSGTTQGKIQEVFELDPNNSNSLNYTVFSNLDEYQANEISVSYNFFKDPTTRATLSLYVNKSTNAAIARLETGSSSIQLSSNIMLSSNGDIFLVSNSGNVSILNIPWRDQNNTTLPMGFNSVLHAINYLHSNASKLLIRRGVVLAVSGPQNRTADTDITWESDMASTNYERTITINGVEFFVSTDPNQNDNNTAVISSYTDNNNNTRLRVTYPTGLSASQNDRIVFKFWKI